ncbi:MAG: hypothetical protein JWM80_6272 [Cyanobacteria bacterium RYN_339]|nr:hypothetical protein [Cyanobacteria bacterium RYN_339]
MLRILVWAWVLVAAFVAAPAMAAADKPEAKAEVKAPQELVPFPPNVQMPLNVGVALYVTNLGKINEGANTYEGSFDLRMRWHDPRLAFNAKDEGTDRLEFGNERAIEKLGQIWNPQISITNMNEKDAQVSPGLFIYEDGDVDFIQRVKAPFETKFALAAFPFDSQSLPMILLSSKYTVNQLAMTQTQEDLNASGLKDGLKIRGWTPGRMEYTFSRIRAWNGDFVPQMEARVTIKRVPNSHLGVLFTPFLLTMLVPSLITLFAKADVAPRLTAWAGSILALVALNFTFSVRYPSLDNDSLVAQLVTTGFSYQMIMVMLTITLFNPPVAEKLMNRFMLAETLNITKWAIPAVFFGILLTASMRTAFTW